jgi:hypothetical protein
VSTVRSCVSLALGLLALLAAAAAVPAAAGAAGKTTWICKPGQADDLCAGTIAGSTLPPPGESAEPLGYTRPKDPPVDCFYLYPTQSEQLGPNSNLDKDPPIRRAVVQQARMFSTVCDVYAPMYRQVTNNGDQSAHNPSVETAYRSARSAFRNYLKRHNDGRGFIMLGHSQGSAHTARLIAELVDTDRKLRKRFVGAIAPGANIAVPIGRSVGGLFEKVPACTEVGQYGCVIAFSTYSDAPPSDSSFGRVDTGYWIYPRERFSAGSHEVMCTDPARLDGGNGVLLPVLNFDYLTAAPAQETESPWASQPDYYKVRCKRQGGAHWLNLSKLNLPGDTRPDLGALVASGINYHVPEVNLAEGNLLRIAELQTGAFTKAQLKSLKAKLKKEKKRRKLLRRKAKRLKLKVRKAPSARTKRAARRKLKRTHRQARAARKEIRSLRKQISALKRQLD